MVNQYSVILGWVRGSTGTTPFSRVLFVTLAICVAPPATVPGQTNDSRTESPPASATRLVTIRAQVPTNTGTVYVAGNCPELGNWNPRGLAMAGTGNERTASVRVPAGARLEFKFTH